MYGGINMKQNGKNNILEALIRVILICGLEAGPLQAIDE
jgi:hypothetical protein